VSLPRDGDPAPLRALPARAGAAVVLALTGLVQPEGLLEVAEGGHVGTGDVHQDGDEAASPGLEGAGMGALCPHAHLLAPLPRVFPGQGAGSQSAPAWRPCCPRPLPALCCSCPVPAASAAWLLRPLPSKAGAAVVGGAAAWPGATMGRCRVGGGGAGQGTEPGGTVQDVGRRAGPVVPGVCHPEAWCPRHAPYLVPAPLGGGR